MTKKKPKDKPTVEEQYEQLIEDFIDKMDHVEGSVDEYRAALRAALDRVNLSLDASYEIIPDDT